jgi:hypothetical protein
MLNAPAQSSVDGLVKFQAEVRREIDGRGARFAKKAG